MKKISLDKIVVDNTSITEILEAYNALKLNIKDSNVKLRELKKFLTDVMFEKYTLLKDNDPNELDAYLLENPMLSEYIDESEYNKSLTAKMGLLLTKKIDLSKLSNGIDCHHEFIKLNNHFMCIKCFIKEEDLDFEDECLCDFLVDVATYQGMYIDELEEGELGLLEQIKMEHKALIEKLKQEMQDMPFEDRNNINETINSLENNKTTEYRNNLRRLRKEKLPMKR